MARRQHGPQPGPGPGAPARALVAVAVAAALALTWGAASAPAGAAAHRGQGRHPAKHRHGGHAPAPAAAQGAGGADGEVEAVETVDLAGDAKADTGAGVGAAPAVGPTGGTPLTLSQVIAHLHPALVHLPIAWMVLWAVWELLALRDAERFRPTLVVLAWFCVASFVPATITGLLHLQDLPDAADVRAPALLHRNLVFLCLASSLALAALASRWRQHGPPGRGAAVATLVALWLQVGVMGYAAHLGGKMVYGDDYLPF